MPRDKEFEQRMQGMVYACRLAQEQGIDALVKTVKKTWCDESRHNCI